MTSLPEVILRRSARGLILFTHGVAASRADEFIEATQQDFGRFKENLNYLLGLGFDVLSMEEVLQLAQDGFRHSKHWLHLTLDDGYANNYALLYPYLKSLGIPWTLFVSSGHIERQERFYTFRIKCAVLNTQRRLERARHGVDLEASAPRSERVAAARYLIKVLKRLDKSGALLLVESVHSLLAQGQWSECDSLYRSETVLTTAQLCELAQDPLVHIGSHSHNHIVLNRDVSAADIEFEMTRSKEWLETTTGRQIRTFAYPNGQAGDFTRTSKDLCRRLGYELAFVGYGRSIRGQIDAMQVPRVSLSAARGKTLKYFVPAKAADLLKRCRELLPGASRGGQERRGS